MATQGSLFDAGLQRPAPPSTLPDPAKVRAELLALLAKARAGTGTAQPWSEKDARMWRTVFPQMANWLPPDEAEQLCAEFAVEMQRLEHEQTLASFGFKLVTRAEFDAAPDIPAGNTREIVRRLAGAFMVYDPDDDDQGWLLVGDDRAELARETVEYRCQPDAYP